MRVIETVGVLLFMVVAGCATPKELTSIPFDEESMIIGRWRVTQVWDSDTGITDIPQGFDLTLNFHERGMVSQDRNGVVTSATYRMENGELIISTRPGSESRFKELGFHGERLIMTQTSGKKEGTVTWQRISD